MHNSYVWSYETWVFMSPKCPHQAIPNMRPHSQLSLRQCLQYLGTDLALLLNQAPRHPVFCWAAVASPSSWGHLFRGVGSRNFHVAMVCGDQLPRAGESLLKPCIKRKPPATLWRPDPFHVTLCTQVAEYRVTMLRMVWEEVCTFEDDTDTGGVGGIQGSGTLCRTVRRRVALYVHTRTATAKTL